MNNLPLLKVNLLKQVCQELKAVTGLEAVVVGGSHAAGQAHSASDLDLGLYYYTDRPFKIDDIRKVARKFSLQANPLVTGFYEWGPWVNGGAWINTRAGKVDFIYRNIEQVEQTLLDLKEGIWYHNFDQQPPYGFRSTIYWAETYICQPLFDGSGVIKRLKQHVQTYPEKLAQTIIAETLWLAEFTLQQCEQAASAGDVYRTVGNFTRVANYIVEAVFALNRTCSLGDKRALDTIETFVKKPARLQAVLNQVLGSPGTTPEQLKAMTVKLGSLWTEVVGLTNGYYKPKF